jgi:hypothetical protein
VHRRGEELHGKCANFSFAEPKWGTPVVLLRVCVR